LIKAAAANDIVLEDVKGKSYKIRVLGNEPLTYTIVK